MSICDSPRSTRKLPDGETQSYVSKVERGERRLDLVQLQAFCQAMKTSLAAFVTEFEAGTRRKR